MSYVSPDGFHLNVVKARGLYVADGSPLFFEDGEYDYGGGSYSDCSDDAFLCERLGTAAFVAPRTGPRRRWTFEGQEFEVTSRRLGEGGEVLTVETANSDGSPYAYTLDCPTGVTSIAFQGRDNQALVQGFDALLRGC